MAQTSTSGRLFENSLKALVKDIVWKNGYKSNMGDKSDNVDPIAVDTYMSGAKYLLMFYSQTKLENVEDFTREQYISFLNTIENDTHKRYFDMFYFGIDFVSISQLTGRRVEDLRADTSKYFKYEEKNDYHRMLFGLPPLNCHERYIIWYVTGKTKVPMTDENGNPRKDADGNIMYEYIKDVNGDPVRDELGNIIYKETEKYEPLHTLPFTKRYEAAALSLINHFTALSEKDHTYDYVKHMLKKRIHPFVSRLAGRFDLLYIDTTSEDYLETLINDFKEVYKDCTQFMILRYYSEAYRNQYEYYEGFIGMGILFMTLQRMHAKYLEADITRDFYELDSIKVVYDAYSVPFFDEIPVTYHHKLIKAINRLISFKGSNTAFMELFDIFEFAHLQIYQYYLLKQHILDENGNPIFVYDEDGNLVPEKMYDIKFVEGNIGDTPYKYLIDDNNDHNYIGVTSADPYWINDGPLYDKIYDTEFNFIETKYIGVKLAYSLTRYLLESSYFLRMLLDNRDNTSKIQAPGKNDMDIFTLVIYIHAIICKVIGINGGIREFIEDPTKMAAVYGYNFVGDLTTIYPYLCRQFIANNNFSEVDDANLKGYMADVMIRLTTKSLNAELFEYFINDKLISGVLSDPLCSECDRIRINTETICHYDNCVYHKADTAEDNNGTRYTMYSQNLVTQVEFEELFEGVYRALRDGDPPKIFDQMLFEYEYGPSNELRHDAEIMAEEFYGTVSDEEYEAIVENYMENLRRDYIDNKMHEFKTTVRAYIAGEMNIQLPKYFTSHWHYLCAKELRSISLIKNYVTGIIDDIPTDDDVFKSINIDGIFRPACLTDADMSKFSAVKAWLENYFKPSRSRDLATIIKDFFLNDTYIKSKTWGIDDGEIAGINQRTLLDSNEYEVLSKIMTIIREDITINKADKYTIADINKSYKAIVDLCTVNENTSRSDKGVSIDRLLWTTKNPKTYYALKRIRQMLLTTQISADVYKKSNGKVADTYYDLLYDINPMLAIDMDMKSDNQLMKELDRALISIKKLCSDLIYIQSYGSINTQRIIDYIYSLLRFFKSAKVELVDFTMQYNVDGRTMNLIKLMSYVKRGDVYTDLSPEEMALYDLINDVCSQVKVNGGDLGIDDYAKIKERYMHVKGSFYFADTLTEKHVAMYRYIDNITLDDILNYALQQTQLSNKLVFKDVIIKYTN